MEKRRCNVTVCIVVLLMGLVLSASVAAMCLAGQFNLDNFYDVGDIYEVPYSTFCTSGTDWIYDAAEGQSEISSENATFVLRLQQDDFAWKYLKMQFKDMNVDQINWHFYFLNSAQEVTGELETSLTEGENVRSIDAGEFRTIKIVAEGQSGIKFGLEKIIFYENEPAFDIGRYLQIAGIVLCGYLAAMLIMWKLIGKWVRKVDFYAPIRMFENGYLQVGRICCKKTPGIMSISQKTRGNVRSMLLLSMFIVMTVVDDTSNYKKVGYNYLLLCCVLLLFLTAIFMIERPLTRLYWKKPMILCWFSLWGMACISDFVVYKDFHYTGYMMLSVIGFLFFAWGNMENPTDFIKDIIRAVRWSFLPACLFCLFFRPLIAGVRYSGINNNPIPFAIYLNMVILAFCAALLEKQQEKEKFWLCVIDIVAVLTAIYMEWKTQSTFSIGLLMLIVLAFLLQGIRVGIQSRSKKFLCYLLMTACLAFPVFAGADWGLKNVSAKLGTQVIFENDAYKITAENYNLPGTEVVYASDLRESRVVQKLSSSKNLDQLTSGRTLYYKVYLRKMNMWGHSGSAFFYGAKHQAHNAIIMIAYRYGVFAAIPYAMLMVYFVFAAWKNLRRNHNSVEAWFLFAVSWSVGLMMMCDNLEQPFRWISWPVYFIGMGYFFTERSVERDLE